MNYADSAAGIHLTLSRLFFPVSIAASVILLASLYLVTDSVIVIQGTYTLVGLILGGTLYYTLSNNQEIFSPNRRVRNRALKGVLILLPLCLTYTVLTGSRTAVLVIGLPVGYALLGLQFLHKQSPSVLLGQIIGLFLLSPLTKYMTTAFYWGGGDLLLREGEFNQLLAEGSTSAIDGLYQFFAGLHLLTSATSLVTGLPTHDSLLLAGLVTYAAVICAIYGIAYRVTQHAELAVAIALGLSFLRPIHHFTSYFYSQALAIALVVFFLLLVFMRCKEDRLALDIALGLLLLAIIITHHLTLVLLLPVIGIMAVVGAFNNHDIIRLRRFAAPFTLLAVFALAYWVFRGWAFWFLVQFIGALRFLSTDLLNIFVEGAGEPTIPALGTNVPTESVLSIVAYPPYVYLVVLLALFAIGIAFILRNSPAFYPIASILVTGVVAAVVMFESPVAMAGIRRIRLPWTLPFAFIIGIGLYRLAGKDRSQVGRVAFVCIVVIAGTSGAMAAADDLGSFSHHPAEQVAYGDAEYKQMAVSADFASEHEGEVMSLWIERQTFTAFGVEASHVPSINESGFSVNEGLFLYRTEWTNHQVRYLQTDRMVAPMYISSAYLDQAVATENHVYTTGEVGLTWGEQQRTIGV